MNCDYYSVLYNDIVLAKGMTLETALLLVKALFETYFNEYDIHYTIMKEPQKDGEE